MRGKAAPAYGAAETKLIEELGVVVGYATGENLAFPGICGGLVALELLQCFEDAAFAEELRAGREVLPAEEAVHELRGSYGGDLFAELAEGQAMNAGQETPLAPFEFVRGGVGEIAAEDGAAGFQAEERFFYFRDGQAEELC